MIRIDPSAAAPIWKQIEEGVRHRIAAGALAPGAPLPSVREMARELRVNPLTVSKAYRQLAGDGMVESRRGEGTFVADAPPELDDAERRRRIDEAALRYASLGKTLGAAEGELVDGVRHAWKTLAEEPRHDR